MRALPTAPTLPLLALALLLSGCTGSDAGTDALDADADAPGGAADGEAPGPAPDAAGGAEPYVQEATVSWLAPASNGCTDPERVPDVGPGVTYGHVDVDEATWGKPFEATFDVQDNGLAIQMTFFDAAGEYLGGGAAILVLNAEPVIEGTVPDDAVEVHLSSCGAVASGATYRAGDL